MIRNMMVCFACVVFMTLFLFVFSFQTSSLCYNSVLVSGMSSIPTQSFFSCESKTGAKPLVSFSKPNFNFALFAHHPQKKIIKKIQDRQPKKHRPSDITRQNVNLNKCITKVEGAPPEYTIVTAEGNELYIPCFFSYIFWIF